MKNRIIPFALALLTYLCVTHASAQVLTPEIHVGIGFNADTNHPAFSGSLRLNMEMGCPSDLLGVSVGLGYRGFFDREPPVEFVVNRSFSDYLLYSRDDGTSKGVRPMGGQFVIPAELKLRCVELDDDIRLFLGCGLEYGVRVYQSDRYGSYYGAHVMDTRSLNIYPQLGIEADLEDFVLNISLYWRHYFDRPFNKQLDIDKFEAINFFGIQIGASF